ncbi:MAG: PKD domain-containing protein [Sphingobacteriales bacterium]|nr:MAG: PKD domain-containing protein [Sphingobacteriales bacterium]
MRRIIPILFAIFFTFAAQAQGKHFNKTYWWGRTHDGRRSIENVDKSIIVCGNYTNIQGGNVHGYLLKISETGDSIWHKTYPYLGEQTYFSHLISIEGGYALTGVIHATSNEFSYRGFLLKTDENGNPLQFTYTGEPADTMPSYIWDMVRTPDGGYLMAGHKINEWIFPYYRKFYLVKLNANLQTEWEQVYDNYTYSNIFSGIAPISNGGGYLLWGSANIFLAGSQTSDLLLAKVDVNGFMEWDSIYILEPPIHGAGVLTPLSDGNFIAIAASGEGGDTQRIIKFSPDGVILWQTTYFSYGCGISAAIELSNGELVFTNCYYPPDDFRTDMGIFKLTPTGNLRWWRRYGNPGFHDYGYGIDVTQDGGFVVAGRQDTSGSAKVWVVRTNCMGLVTPMPQASFSWQADAINPFSLQFTNLSHFVYADSIDGGKYIWDWGDGSPPVTFPSESFQEVFHNYPAPGNYTVTLTAIVCQDTSIVQATIETLSGAGGTVGLPPDPLKGEKSLQVYPNPTQNTLTFQRASKEAV